MNELDIREELRSQIESAYQRSLPRLYWGSMGRILARIFGGSGEAPMWLIGLVAYGLVFAAVSVAGYLLDQPLSPAYSIPLSVYTWLCAVVFDSQVRQMILSLKHDLVDLFDLEADPAPLRRWLRFANSLPLQLAWLVFCIVNMGMLTIIIVYNQSGQQAGAIVYIFTGLIFLQFLTHFYWLFLLAVTFAHTIGTWNLLLFPENPAGTPDLQRLYRSSSSFLLSIAFILASNLLLAIPMRLYSSVYLSTFGLALALPTLVFFLSRERAFSALVMNAKLTRLDEIQNQISIIKQKASLSEKDSADAVIRILDLHDRIRSTPDNLINLDSILNLVGSLALPLLATLISLLDVWQKIFPAP